METSVKHIKTNYIKPVLVAAALAAMAPAWSQEDAAPAGPQAARSNAVQFYGMIDQGVEAVNGRFAATNERDTSYRISNGIITPHFGFRGSEDLGGGMRASFNIEGSFTPDDGQLGIGGRIAGRQAHVDLSGSFGTVSLGRQYTMVRYGWEDANPFGTGNQGLKLLDPRISNPRADNAITYIAKWGALSGGVNYSAGWDAVNGNPATAAAANCPGEVTNKRQCREWSAGLKYTGGAWGVAASWERLYGGTAATFGGLTSPEKTDTRAVVSAYLKFRDSGKLGVGWIRRDNMGIATPKSDMAWVQAVVPIGQYSLDGLLAELKYRDSANKAVLVNLRGRYNLSKRTVLYVTAAFMNNSGALNLAASGSSPILRPLPGGSQTSVIAGIQHRF
jgi:predicted porin